MKRILALVGIFLVLGVASAVHAQLSNNAGQIEIPVPIEQEQEVLPLALGETGADLLYTPVTPCRIIDTRFSAGGSIANGATRNFFVVGTGGFEGQGGQSGGCGIPGDAAAAMINFVVVGPGASGDIRAWPFGGGVPNSSIINFAPVSGLNIANGVIQPICHPIGSCVSDLTVLAEGSTIHLVADVLGYFRQFPFPAVRGFAYVTTVPSFEPTWTKGFNAVRRQATGVYCLTLPGISSSNTFASVGVEWGNSAGSDLLAFLQHGNFSCNAGEFEVRTFKFASGVGASDQVAFWILVP